MLCAYSLLGDAPEVTVIEDAATDPRSAHSPLVLGPAGLRFYAGAPLVGSRGEGRSKSEGGEEGRERRGRVAWGGRGAGALSP